VDRTRLSGLTALLQRRGLLANEGLPAHGGAPDPAVGAIRYDSRQVQPGDVFVARRGQHTDGHEFAMAAVSAGAVAVIVERPVPGLSVPELLVRDARTALALAAAWRAGDPSQRLGIVGITGTDGKTTTGYLVRAVLEGAGRQTGLLGTTDVIIGGHGEGNAARTSTPEAPELQDALARMEGAGDTWAVVESTSHGLAQQRVGGVAYDVAVLTNVTSEHLEFHGTLEAYREAKQTLFRRLARSEENPEKGWGKHAVVNADDGQGEVAATNAVAAGASVVRYGWLPAASTAGRPGSAGGVDDGRQRDGPPLDVAAARVIETPAGLQAELHTPGWRGSLDLRLAGRFNVTNALAAMGVAMALDLDRAAAAASLAAVESVPGRMQRIDEGQPFSVIVDYAHTAEALAKVLDELRPGHPGAGLIAVFGSAGERDVTKRPEMGRVAGERCRIVVLTDEDPRREDRLAILEAIAEGAERAGKRRGEDLLLVPDRAEAISIALRLAQPGDAVLLAGKGHEKTIETAGGEVPWDEAAVARVALRSR
jgi:UDP-N-acetylmuramoyl-L-alanyl-D-glutamate--2,6-diaminopimelate ligase